MKKSLLIFLLLIFMSISPVEADRFIDVWVGDCSGNDYFYMTTFRLDRKGRFTDLEGYWGFCGNLHGNFWCAYPGTPLFMMGSRKAGVFLFTHTCWEMEWHKR
jgi:hypothetical protein